MGRREKTLAEYLIGRIGFGKTAKVLAFVAAWGLFIEKKGRPPEGIKEYSEFWDQSLSVGYRESYLFKVAFPDHEDPTEIWLAAREQVNQKAERRVLAFELSGARLAI